MTVDAGATPVPDLSWGDPGNSIDFGRAHRGQWFLGVVNMTSGRVFLVPSDLEPPDAVTKETELRRSVGQVYVSRPQPGVPGGQWQSQDLGGNAGINSPPGALQGGLRQHGRVCTNYGQPEPSCFGFAVIKFDNAHGEFRDRSQSLNGDAAKHGGQPMRMSPSGRSARMPANWSTRLKAWLQAELGSALQDTVAR